MVVFDVILQFLVLSAVLVLNLQLLKLFIHVLLLLILLIGVQLAFGLLHLIVGIKRQF